MTRMARWHSKYVRGSRRPKFRGQGSSHLTSSLGLTQERSKKSIFFISLEGTMSDCFAVCGSLTVEAVILDIRHRKYNHLGHQPWLRRGMQEARMIGNMGGRDLGKSIACSCQNINIQQDIHFQNWAGTFKWRSEKHIRYNLWDSSFQYPGSRLCQL